MFLGSGLIAACLSLASIVATTGGRRPDARVTRQGKSTLDTAMLENPGIQQDAVEHMHTICGSRNDSEGGQEVLDFSAVVQA